MKVANILQMVYVYFLKTIMFRSRTIINYSCMQSVDSIIEGVTKALQYLINVIVMLKNFNIFLTN